MVKKKRYKKFTKIKRKRRKTKKIIFCSILFFLTFLSLIYLVVFSPLFFITNIEIKNQKGNLSAKIYSYLLKNTAKRFFGLTINSLIFINSKKIEQKILKDFPQLKNVKIKRVFLKRTLSLSYKEREMSFLIKDITGNLFSLGKDGVVIGLLKRNYQKDLPIIKVNKKTKVGERVFQKILLEKVYQIINFLKKDLKIKEILVKEKELTLKTEFGFKIYFSLEKSISLQLIQLQLLLTEEIPLEKRKNLDYIDLRFSKVYYKEK